MFENYTASFEIETQRIELSLWDTSGKRLSVACKSDGLLLVKDLTCMGSKNRVPGAKHKRQVRLCGVTGLSFC